MTDDTWQVQIGILKMKVNEKDLEFIKTPKVVETRDVASVKGRDFHVKPELDLRGERYENALLRVEKYIDDALLAGISSCFHHPWKRNRSLKARSTGIFTESPVS